MSNVINLRRTRKDKAKREKEAQAHANRIKHGIPKSAKTLADARTKKAARDIEAHKLDKKD